MELWNRVDKKIEELSTSRKAVAIEAGFTPNNFGSWKSRNTYPTADVLVKIAKALGVTVEYLVTGKDNADPWLMENGSLVRNLKALTPEQLETVAETVSVLAARNLEKAKHG